MANVNDVLADKGEKSFYYDNGDNKSNGSTDKPKWQPFVEGEYLGHIVDASTRVVEWQDYKARVYNFKVKVHQDTDLVLKSGYAGREIKSIGVFRYLEPSKGDSFVSHPSGNRNYLNFCEALGVECPTEKRKIDGKEVEVKALPSLNVSDISGRPVKAVVKQGKSFKAKDGKTRFYMDVKWVMKWEDGKIIETNEGSNEIPF